MTITLALCALGCSAIATAAQIADVRSSPHIMINGRAEQLLKPDAYTVIVGVETSADTPDAAMAQNTTTIERVLAEAKRLGIAPSDLRTSYVSLRQSQGTRQFSYMADNLIHVTLRDINQAGQMLAALINAGANRVHGIRPLIKRDEDLLNRLRGEAVVKARQAAETTATAAGVRLGRILSISAQHYDWQRAMVAPRVVGQDLSNVPIEPGLIPIAIDVSVTWAVEQ
jgi:uncharacterized protein YggE